MNCCPLPCRVFVQRFAAQTHLAPSGPPTQKEMQPLMDLLNGKEAKDNLKKMFGNIFRQP